MIKDSYICPWNKKLDSFVWLGVLFRMVGFDYFLYQNTNPLFSIKSKNATIRYLEIYFCRLKIDRYPDLAFIEPPKHLVTLSKCQLILFTLSLS